MAILTCQDTGKGFPVVLIHGFCESRSVWTQAEHLLAGDYRVVLVDLPGFGGSAVPAEALTIESLAADVQETLQSLGITKSIMIGHSLGGYVALAYAEAYRQHLAGLGLFHSSAMADTEEKKENRNKVIESVKNYGTEPFLRTLIPGLFYEGNRERLQPVIDRTIEEGKNIDPQTIIRTTAAMRDRKDRRHVLSNLAVPVLFIAGKQDTAVPLHATMEQVSLPKDSVVQLLDQTGHMGMFEAQGKTLKMMRNFASYCQ